MGSHHGRCARTVSPAATCCRLSVLQCARKLGMATLTHPTPPRPTSAARAPAPAHLSRTHVRIARQQSVIAHMAAKKRDCEVAAATGVDRHTVAKLRLSLEYWGQCCPPPTVRLGRPRLLLQAQLDALAEYLHGRPSAYLEEMQDYLYKEFDIEASISTVWRALGLLNYTRKLATKRAREQSEPLRRVYRARMARYQAE